MKVWERFCRMKGYVEVEVEDAVAGRRLSRSIWFNSPAHMERKRYIATENGI